MRQKLERKGYDAETVDLVMEYLLERDYINDHRYACSYIRSKRSRYGRRRIASFLYSKGIGQDIFESALAELEEYSEGLNELEGALKAARKRYSILKSSFSRSELPEYEKKYKIKSRILNHLAGRGYDYSVSLKAYDEAVKTDLD